LRPFWRICGKSGEGREKMVGRVACDHQYIREWSFWMDLKILCKTLLVVLSQRNAY